MKKSLEQKQTQELSKVQMYNSKSKQSGYSFRANTSFMGNNLDTTQNINKGNNSILL